MVVLFPAHSVSIQHSDTDFDSLITVLTAIEGVLCRVPDYDATVLTVVIWRAA